MSFQHLKCGHCVIFVQSYESLCVGSVATPFEAVTLVGEMHVFEWSE